MWSTVISSPNVSLTNFWMSTALASLPNFFNAFRTASILVGFDWPALLPLTLFSAIGTSRCGTNDPSPQPYPSLTGCPREGDLHRPDGAALERHLLSRRQDKGDRSVAHQTDVGGQSLLGRPCRETSPSLWDFNALIPITGCPLARG